MSCRAPGCEKNEWMARKFCDRHWKMLPTELQQRIRMMLGARRWKADLSELQPLLDEATLVIVAVEQQQHADAHVTLYRTRMAAVTGLVMTIRQLPFPEMRAQLQESIDDLLANRLDLYRERQIGIERDMAFLEFFIEARERLGLLIKSFTPPAPAAADDLDALVETLRDATSPTIDEETPEVIE